MNDHGSEFLIQIIHKDDGKVVAWEPGKDVEAELIDAITNRILTKSVGVFRTKSQVASAVKTAIEEILYELKSRV